MIAEFSKPDDASFEYWKQQIACGNEQAFRSLFNAYAPRLTAFAFSITRNREASIDVVDEVFVKIWRRRDRIQQIENITTYLYTATKNTALNLLSRKAREVTVDSFDFIDVALRDDYAPDQQLITAEILSRIKKAVDALPPKCKLVFKLVREDGLKYKEVAEILEISEKTVDAQLVIAVKRIGDAVGKYFDYFPARFQKK
ncbi:RNA polymerase sigma-70 factor [Niabella insulamsoli]|uniref:RNA polymerase sigma-70 factor n=1 Tax=Niabella insulamsoli TaxID=3144874 RepID=UPI0031FD37CD